MEKFTEWRRNRMYGNGDRERERENSTHIQNIHIHIHFISYIFLQIKAIY